MANTAIIPHKVRDFFTGNSEHVIDEMNGIYIAGERDSYLADLFQSLAVNGAGLVRNWAGSGKRVKACRDLLADSGYACETRFDAAHGRRYLMAVYPSFNADQRRRALAALDGMRNTNPEFSA